MFLTLRRDGGGGYQRQSSCQITKPQPPDSLFIRIIHRWPRTRLRIARIATDGTSASAYPQMTRYLLFLTVFFVTFHIFYLAILMWWLEKRPSEERSEIYSSFSNQKKFVFQNDRRLLMFRRKMHGNDIFFVKSAKVHFQKWQTV